MSGKGAPELSVRNVGDLRVAVIAAQWHEKVMDGLVDGALRWSARRNGRTVIDTSALGLRLGDGTVLGTDVQVIREQYGTHRTTWTPVYGRNATVTDHYQDQRWDLVDRASGIRFGVQARAYKTGVALRYLLLDEVTSALDPELVGEVLELIRELKGDGMTMLIATHEMGFARDVADEVCFLHDGRILERGAPDSVLGSPQQPETQRFLRRLSNL